MFQRSWSVIYRMSLVILLIALMGLFVQVKSIEPMHITMIAALSGLICLFAYRRKSNNRDIGDFTKMLDVQGGIRATADEAWKNVSATTSNDESVIVGVADYVFTFPKLVLKRTLRLQLIPWRFKGGAVEEGSLTVQWPKPVFIWEYKRIASHFARDNVIVELRVKDVTDNGYDGKDAQLVRIVSIDVTDSELERVAIERHMPVDLEFDGKLVRFSEDEEEGTYAGTVQWRGNTICLYLDTNDSRETQACANIAKMLLADAPSWDQKLRERVAALLVKENRNLIRPEDRNKSQDALLSQLRLERVEVTKHGTLMFNFKEGDIFPDKQIVIFGDLKEGLEEAKLY